MFEILATCLTFRSRQLDLKWDANGLWIMNFSFNIVKEVIRVAEVSTSPRVRSVYISLIDFTLPLLGGKPDVTHVTKTTNNFS
jgi:hypothetical protein